METKNPNWFAKHKVLTVIIVLIILGTIGSLSSQSGNKNNVTNSNKQVVDNTTKPKEEAINITAKELMNKYESNQIDADNLYKGKLLNISGNVGTIGKDILDTPYITLEVSGSFTSVQCMLNEAEMDKASKLKKGDPIIAEGRVNGYIMNVIVKDCIIK